MKEFKYVITDPEGIHARPAGILVKQAAGYQSAVTIAKGEKSADAKRIFGVMGLGVKTVMKTQQQQNWRHSSRRIYKSNKENL